MERLCESGIPRFRLGVSRGSFGGGTPGKTDWALGRQGCCAGGDASGWDADALDVLRDYRRFVPLDRRSDESRWSHMETRGRLPCDSDALKTDLRGTRFTFSGLT